MAKAQEAVEDIGGDIGVGICRNKGGTGFYRRNSHDSQDETYWDSRPIRFLNAERERELCLAAGRRIASRRNWVGEFLFGLGSFVAIIIPNKCPKQSCLEWFFVWIVVLAVLEYMVFNLGK